MTQEVMKAEQPIAVYDPFRSQMAELREINAKTVFNYEDPKGNKDARSHIHKLRKTKAAVDKARKVEKDASLSYGRRVDAEAKEIRDEIDNMIDIHEKPIKEIEEREELRKARHQQALGHMAKMVTDAAAWATISVDTLQDWLTEIEAVPTGDAHWQEFAEEAAQTRDAAIKALGEAVANRRRHDEEQAELARLRAEAEERQRQDEARQAEERRKAEEAEQRAEAERIAKQAAERATKEAEAKAERQRQEAERQARERESQLELERERAEREKAEALAAVERATREAEEKQQRRQEAEEAKARKRAEDTKRRKVVHNKAVDALEAEAIHRELAERIIELIAEGKVPGVTIIY